jgi:DNA helicase IV
MPERRGGGSVVSATPADELDAERAHLAQSRAGLGRMRERADSLEAAGGNAVSTEYLAATLYRRRMSLVDDPSTPLFFGRTDVESAAHGIERFYIGRRHVHDEHGDPMVVDWRADISRAFYRASAAEPMGLRLRRRFGFMGGTMTAFEDETFSAADAGHGPSRILTEEIERPRVGPMRDIVATIQPDQDEIVRADLAETLCVQGGPGTGKTAVGLHRAAYLLYAFRARLRGGGVLVVGPNTAFLHYIEQVLPALGEVEVTQLTVAELVGHVQVRATDTADVQRLKGDPRMAEVLRRAVWNHSGAVDEAVVVSRGAFRLRLYPSQVEELRDALIARGLRYGAARGVFATMLGSALTAQVEARGEPADDRTVAELARHRAVRDCVNAVWPPLDPVTVVFALLTDAATLAAAADGVLSADEQRLLHWPVPPRSKRGARWSASDAVLVDEVVDLLDRTASFGHVVLDEAQDLSPMQCRAVGRRCSTGSATVLGDLAQGTSATAADSWQTTLVHLGKPDGRVQVLETGYRVPREVVEFAALLLPVAAPGVSAPLSIRSSAEALRVEAVAPSRLAAAVAAACLGSLELPGSVGVVVADTAVLGIGRALRAAGIEHLLLGSDLGDDSARVARGEAGTGAGPDEIGPDDSARGDAGSGAGPDVIVRGEAGTSAGPDEIGPDDSARGEAGSGAGLDVIVRVTLVPASLAKGLEFDHVVVVEPADIAAGPDDDGSFDLRHGLRRLYIALTRAVSGLVVVHAKPLPAALAAASPPASR